MICQEVINTTLASIWSGSHNYVGSGGNISFLLKYDRRYAVLGLTKRIS